MDEFAIEAPGERNVLGEPLQACGSDPLTGFTRSGYCEITSQGAVHTICVVVTADFLDHQRELGNDLITPHPQWGFPGLRPGDRWCVVAPRWVQSHEAGRAAPVVMACSHEAALDHVSLAVLKQYAVDVPHDLRGLLD